jgi:hypothetical protein
MTLSPLATRIAFSLLELPIAYGVFRVATLAGYRLGCALTPCHDLEGIGVIVYTLPIAAVVAIAYWVAAWRMKTRWRRRIALDAIAVLLGVASYVFA